MLLLDCFQPWIRNQQLPSEIKRNTDLSEVGDQNEAKTLEPILKKAFGSRIFDGESEHHSEKKEKN